MAFPNSLFPGVYTRLVDTSFSIGSTGPSIAFTAFMSQKGVDNQLTSLSSTDDLISRFGSIDSGRYGQGMLILSQWFIAASNAFAIRVLPDETNLPCQNSVYDYQLGTYSPSKIKLKEAAYSNLVVQVDGTRKIEVVSVGPENYGIIRKNNPTPRELADDFIDYDAQIKVDTTYLFTDAKQYDIILQFQKTKELLAESTQALEHFNKFEEYALNVYKEGTGLNNFLIINIGVDAWTDQELGGIGTATIDYNEAVIATFTKEKEASKQQKLQWEEKEKLVEDEEELEKYFTVLDIIKTVPLNPNLNDRYFLAKEIENDEEAKILGWKNGLVVEYIQNEMGEKEWKVSKPSNVIIDQQIFVVDSLPATPDGRYLNRNYFINPFTQDPEFKSRAGLIFKAVATRTDIEVIYSWELYTIDLQINVPDTVSELVLINALSNTYWIRHELPLIEQIVKVTSDMDALFPTRIRRTAQMDSILASSRPDLAGQTGHNAEPLFIFYPVGRGSYYNNLQIAFRLSSKTAYLGTSDENDYDRTLMLEIYDLNSGSKLLLESFEVSLNPDAKDEVNDVSMFIVDVLDKHSKVLRCKSINTGYLTYDKKTGQHDYMKTINKQLDTLTTEHENSNKIGNIKNSLPLNHGDEGNLYDSNNNINWQVANSLLAKAFTGTIINPDAEDPNNPYEIDVLDTEMVLIDVILDAGYAKGVKNAMQQLSEARQNDCFVVLDMKDNTSAEAAYQARTSEGGIGKEFNTPYVALYEPYSNIYDRFTGNDIWVSPIYHVARALALTDRDYGKHYAPAGETRGVCYNINKLRYNVFKDSVQKENFMIYNINPIICNRNGYAIYNQSTSYLKNSKLRDINIVRILLEIQRDLKRSLAGMLFEMNDNDTYNAIDVAVRRYMGDKVSKKVIESFDIQVVATDYDKEQHRCQVNLLIVPKQCLYQILLTISV